MTIKKEIKNINEGNQKRRCFGTKEYSENHNLCKVCKLKEECKNVSPKKRKLHIKFYITPPLITKIQ